MSTCTGTFFFLLFPFSHLFGLGIGGPASQRVAGVWQDSRTTGEASGKLWENMYCELGGKGGMGAGRPGNILRLPVSLELNECGVNMPSSWGRKRTEKFTAECVSSSPGSSTDVQWNPLQVACVCLSFPFWEMRGEGKVRAMLRANGALPADKRGVL